MEGMLIAGKYEVIRKLGEGASGQVYLVRHKDLNIRLALKILKSDFSRDPILLDLFKREAEVLFRFSHEGCVQMRDFGALEDGSYFMATDFSEGGTLRDLLTRTGRLDVNYALSIIIRILDVLEAAHQLGIIHRDIKPENIIIERDYKGNDNIKVLDFGVAHLLSMEFETDEDFDAFGTVGTPCYMSPEQALGEKRIDGRADLYSVGIIAYEMLIGRVPFDSHDILEILCQQVTQIPQPFPPGYFIPAFVETVIIKSLEKNRENRFQTATKFKSELLTALKQIQENNDSDSNNKFVPNTDITSNASLIDKKEVVETNDKQYKTDIESDESNNFYMSQNIAPLDTEIERGKKKHSILVLDDDNTILDIISHILSNADCSVFTSTNIGTIHSYLFMNNVDLLITDLNMPQLNGVQVCKLFKKTLPSLKILLFSNIPERDLAKKAKEACADGYISKNTTPNEWIQAIKGYLD